MNYLGVPDKLLSRRTSIFKGGCLRQPSLKIIFRSGCLRQPPLKIIFRGGWRKETAPEDWCAIYVLTGEKFHSTGAKFRNCSEALQNFCSRLFMFGVHCHWCQSSAAVRLRPPRLLGASLMISYYWRSFSASPTYVMSRTTPSELPVGVPPPPSPPTPEPPRHLSDGDPRCHPLFFLRLELACSPTSELPASGTPTSSIGAPPPRGIFPGTPSSSTPSTWLDRHCVRLFFVGAISRHQLIQKVVFL